MPAPTPSLVTLGIFPKRRHPDLVAHDGKNVELPLLRRAATTRVLMGLLMQRLPSHGYKGEPDLLRQLARLTEQIVALNPADARKAFEEYSQILRAGPAFAEREAHIRFVEHFVEATHVLALVPYQPGEVCTITYRYTESSRFPGWPRPAQRREVRPAVPRPPTNGHASLFGTAWKLQRPASALESSGSRTAMSQASSAMMFTCLRRR